MKMLKRKSIRVASFAALFCNPLKGYLRDHGRWAPIFMITLSIALGAQASFGQGRHQGEGQGAASASNAPLCDPNTVQIVTQDGPVPFSIALAQTAAERSRGLMYVASMPEDMGMLFVYEKAGPVSFWMKNTLIPLDMIFTDTRGVIVSIHKNAIPHDETPIFGGNAIFSVLELNAGVSEAKNIKIGDVLLHPAYDFYTSLPCGAK